MLALAVAALAFAGASRPMTGSSAVQMGAKKAAKKAVRPASAAAAAKELGADVETNGFWDPRGYTQQYPFEQLRLAEVKHGRAAMLGITGIFVTEFYRLPNSAGLFQAKTPLEALSPSNVPPLGLLQIILVVGIIELRTKNYPSRIPGDIGFDPLGLSADGIRDDYALQVRAVLGRQLPTSRRADATPLRDAPDPLPSPSPGAQARYGHRPGCGMRVTGEARSRPPSFHPTHPTIAQAGLR